MGMRSVQWMSEIASLFLVLPWEVAAVQGPRGLRLVGPGEQIIWTVRQFEEVSKLSQGEFARLEDWILVVSEFVPDSVPARTVVMPASAWRMAAGQLADVAYGYYPSPLDFSELGYLKPPPVNDVGVEVTDL